MKNQKLIQSYDRAAPTAAQEEKMLAAILARANTPAAASAHTRHAKVLRRAVLLAAILALLTAASVIAGRMVQKWSLPKPESYQPNENGGIYDVHTTTEYPDTVQSAESASAQADATSTPDEPVSAAPDDAALIASAKEILLAAGLDDVDTSAADVVRQTHLRYDREEAEVVFTNSKPQTTVKFSADTGTLLSLSAFSDEALPDAPLYQTDEAAEAMARHYYELLPVQQGYYVTAVSKYDEISWSYDFCRQVTDGIYNPYECVRICINRYTGRLELCNVFNFPLLDDHDADDVPLTQDAAIQAAKTQSGMSMEGYTLRDAHIGCVLPNWSFTEHAQADLKAAKVSRLAWVLEYEDEQSEFADIVTFHIDCYTGELLGGDST